MSAPAAGWASSSATADRRSLCHRVSARAHAHQRGQAHQHVRGGQQCVRAHRPVSPHATVHVWRASPVAFGDHTASSGVTIRDRQVADLTGGGGVFVGSCVARRRTAVARPSTAHRLIQSSSVVGVGRRPAVSEHEAERFAMSWAAATASKKNGNMLDVDTSNI